MLKFFLLVLIAGIITSCSQKDSSVNFQEQLKKDTTLKAQQLLYSQPIVIDSSGIVIYPLILQKGDDGGSYLASSSGGARISYWNLIFYNTQTGTQTILTDKKVVINSIDFATSASSVYEATATFTNGINIYKDYILYSAVSSDYNGNKILDDADPAGLFVSKRDGTDFRLVSPVTYNILSWQTIKGSSKLILQGQKDDNGDKKFDRQDATVPLVVELNSTVQATPVFTSTFEDSLKQKMISIWKQ